MPMAHMHRHINPAPVSDWRHLSIARLFRLLRVLWRWGQISAQRLPAYFLTFLVQMPKKRQQLRKYLLLVSISTLPSLSDQVHFRPYHLCTLPWKYKPSQQMSPRARELEPPRASLSPPPSTILPSHQQSANVAKPYHKSPSKASRSRQIPRRSHRAAPRSATQQTMTVPLAHARS